MTGLVTEKEIVIINNTHTHTLAQSETTQNDGKIPWSGSEIIRAETKDKIAPNDEVFAWNGPKPEKNDKMANQ